MRDLRRLFLLLLLSMTVLSAVVPVRAVSYAEHPGIWILSDSGFTVANGVVSGSGSPEDPYIIEGWDITVLGSSVFFTLGARAGVLVENTTAHFIIRNVLVHDGPVSSANIVLKNVTNGRVEDSQIASGNIGLVLWKSTKSVTVAGNDISGFNIGVYLLDSSGNIIVENSMLDVGRPIFTSASSRNRFLGNRVEWQRATASATGIALTRNSSSNIFQGNTIHGGVFGISVYLGSHSNLISGNLIQGVEEDGVSVGTGSSGNIVEGNMIRDSGVGVLLNGAFETRVRSNWISAFTRTSFPGLDRFTGKGVWLLDSSHTWVTGNTVVAPVGISICRSSMTFLAPPPNDLRGSDRGVLAGPNACS